MLLNGLRFYEQPPLDEWPFYLPAIRQIIEHGLAFSSPLTFIVGENGAGKSTLVEAIAEAYGLDVRGGHGGRQYASPNAGKSPLSNHLKLELTPMGYRTKSKNAQGFFLRSETAMGVFEYMSNRGVEGYGNNHLGEISHGEGYIQVFLADRFQKRGLYLLDEPEAPLSFNSCLLLAEQLRRIVQQGSQVICATHSPIITALPSADILEISEQGIHKKKWQELELTQHWQRFMGHPAVYLNNLV
jgi:predicted ATPase